MAVLLLKNQPVDNWITGLPTDGHLEIVWLQAPHTAHPVWSRPHEGDLRLQQEYCVSAQPSQGMEAADTSGMPPCLERKVPRRNTTAHSAFD